MPPCTAIPSIYDSIVIDLNPLNMSYQIFLDNAWHHAKRNLKPFLHWGIDTPKDGNHAAPAVPAFKPLAFDPILEKELEKLGSLEALLSIMPSKAEDVAPLGGDIEHEERTIPGPDGNTLLLSIFRRRADPPTSGNENSSDTTAAGATQQQDKRSSSKSDGRRLRPCIYDIHGGGMVVGNRFSTVSGFALAAVRRLDAVCVSVEYRLAPAHPDPAPVEDCYAGLVWTAAAIATGAAAAAEGHDEGHDGTRHPLGLLAGVDPARLVVSGASAGGGLAAAVALMARDRGGPVLAGQVLQCPMLDDRSGSLDNEDPDAPAYVSPWQMAGRGVWDREANLAGWGALLGERRGGPDGLVSPYAAPARCRNLSGLPPAYVDAASCETFRDEDVRYALNLWRDGTQCELHVWPGGFHGFDAICPEVDISVAAREAKLNWLARLLGE